MKVVAVSSAKGGVGKSTICVHLAVAAEAAGLATAIFDLDPQASVALWSDHRGEPIPAVVAAQAPRLSSLLKQARERGADLVFLDTPPHASGVSADACALADVVLVPCRPSAFDLDSVGASIRVASAVKKPVWVVVNAAPTQGTEVAETQAALLASGVNVAPVVVHQRKAYSARAHEGRTALEFEPGGKAAREIETLLAWLAQITGFALYLDPRIASPAVTKVRKPQKSKGARLRGGESPRDQGSDLPSDTVTKGPRSRSKTVACDLAPRVVRYASSAVRRVQGGGVASEGSRVVTQAPGGQPARYQGHKGPV